MSNIRKLMESTKGYSEVSQEVQEGWLKDTFDKVVDTLGLGDADRDRVTDAAKAKQAEIDALEAKVQAELDKKANDKFQNDRIDSIANASDAEAKARADAQAAKDAEAGSDDADDAAAATTTTAANTTTARRDKVAKTKDLANKTAAADAPANTDASIKKAQDQVTPDLTPGPASNTDASIKKAQDQVTPDLTPEPATAATTTTADTPPPGTNATGETPAATPASNGSLLGRKLDLKTPNLMKAYNDGGKKAMPAIKNMQTALSRLGFDPNGLDGKYGNGTFKAVQGFQKANGLAVDGQAGPETMKSMKDSLDGNFEKNKASPDEPAKDEPAKAAVQPNPNEVNRDAPVDAPPVQPNPNEVNKDTLVQPNADLKRYIELLNKLEGPQQVSASYDFRDLIALVETKLNEQLTQAEMTELKALHDKVQGHVGLDTELDTKITTALNRYLKLVKEPASAASATPASATARDGGNPGGTTKAVEPKVSKEWYIQMPPNRNASKANWNVSKTKAEYPKPYVDIPQADGTIHRGYGPLANLENFVKNNPKLKARMVGKPTTQTASKDNNMKKAIEESASMNVSMTADNASEVADLMALLKNAGMPDASPVSDMPMMPSKELPTPHDHEHGGHDDMKSMIKLMGDDDAACGEDCDCDSCATDEDSSSEEYDAIVDEWDNSPEEEYKDHQHMTKDLSGGINREKKAYAKAQDGDNAMAVENSIKEQLWAALNEKKADIKTTEGRGRGKTLNASRGEKLNASRGSKLMAGGRGRGGRGKNKTEGSRGKASRGKKSRG